VGKKALIDLAGQRFGHLTAIERAESAIDGHAQWRVRCDCGKEKIVRGNHLTSGKIQSCGCLQKKIASVVNITHGDTRDYQTPRLYRIWANMKQRTSNPNHNKYLYYGGRGIRVCREWWNRYVAFRDWALCHGYNDSLSIDRIDNDKGYFPENCRWANQKEQCRNNHRNHLLTIGKETLTLIEWSIKTGINESTLRSRLKCGQSPEQALRLEAA